MAAKQQETALAAYLVAAARTGDQDALARLVRFRRPRLVAHAACVLGDVEAARDVVQDAWVAILRGLEDLRGVEAFLPWALPIVTGRRVAKVIKGRQRDRLLATQYVQEVDMVVSESEPAAADGARVRAVLGQLSRDQAATVALFYLADMDVADVALAMDAPGGTAKTRLSHARDKLRAILEGDQNAKA